MSWQEGDGFDPFAVDLVREHLDKAENWLVLAEGNRGELIDLRERLGRDHVTDEGMYLKDMMTSAIQLAELHRAMAQTIDDLTPRRIVQADNADDVKTMGEALAEKMQADDEAHQVATLRPGVDPEPEAEGELWTARDGWFYYSASAIPAAEAAGPGAGYLEKNRWLLARHYAQVLRWNSEQGAKPMPLTWAEVGESLTDGDVCGTLRRPTAEERAAFYGPEPDPQPAIEETHERPTTIPTATLGEAFRTPYGAAAESPEGPVRFDATVQAFSDDAVEEMYQAVKRERTRRAYTAPEDRGMFRDRG